MLKAFSFAELIMKTILLGIFLSLYSFMAIGESFTADIVSAAIKRTEYSVRYDGAYIAIPYPNGDVPADTGVCTDVIIRSYRALGTDLQKLVYEDMSANFNAYPSKRIWGLSKTDKNIDHRRVPNLQTFFGRYGDSLAISSEQQDYQAGDIVTWMIAGKLPHIGLVTDQISSRTGNPLIVHNVGEGPKLEDMLFTYQISGHYRFIPQHYPQ